MRWNSTLAMHRFLHTFQTARDIVANKHVVRVYGYDRLRGCSIVKDYVNPDVGRDWFSREVNKYDLHGAVEQAMQICRPDNWQQLLLEWPHQSVDDHKRIAYTVNERKGEADVQTVTSIGKYLTRHFSALHDHEIRDIVAHYVGAGDCRVIEGDVDAIVNAAIRGPKSCMSNSFDIDCDDGKTRHPYEVYDPAYGWHIAVREHGGEIMARALCLHDEDNGPVFVRSYKRDPHGGYSHADESLEAWLKSQGYTKKSGWPELARLAYHPVCRGEFLLPYIDGDVQHVNVKHGAKPYLELTDCGDYCATNTDGLASEAGVECEDCGDIHDEEDSYWVGRYEDRRVCPRCLRNEYVYAYGARGQQYYEITSECSYCDDDGEWYVDDYLSDNNMVLLNNGSLCDMENAVCIESCDEWFHLDDERICLAEDTERYELVDDCWCCVASGKWYTDDTDYIEVDGEPYHPDNAPETEETKGE